MSKSLIIALSLWLALVVPFKGEANPAEQKRYRDPILPLLTGGLIGPAEKSLVLRARTSDGRIPPAGPKLEICAAAGKIVLESDADGFIRFPFKVELLRENPPFFKLNENLTFELRITAMTRPGIQRRMELSVSQKPFIERGVIRVWHPAGQAAAARELIERLAGQHDLLAKEMGLAPVPWGINLVDEDLSGVNQTTLQDYPKWLTWSLPLEDISSREADRANLHEWVETTLDDRVDCERMEGEDQCRFVADGLAEYLSIRCLRFVPSSHFKLLEELLAQGGTCIDLPKRFHWPKSGWKSSAGLKAAMEEFPAGYALSFVFWERACAAHGRDLPKRFLAALEGEAPKDYESYLRVLEQLTGCPSVRNELAAMDVKKALLHLQNLSKQLIDESSRSNPTVR